MYIYELLLKRSSCERFHFESKNQIQLKEISEYNCILMRVIAPREDKNSIIIKINRKHIRFVKNVIRSYRAVIVQRKQVYKIYSNKHVFHPYTFSCWKEYHLSRIRFWSMTLRVWRETLHYVTFRNVQERAD